MNEQMKQSTAESDGKLPGWQSPQRIRTETSSSGFSQHRRLFMNIEELREAAEYASENEDELEIPLLTGFTFIIERGRWKGFDHSQSLEFSIGDDSTLLEIFPRLARQLDKGDGILVRDPLR